MGWNISQSYNIKMEDASEWNNRTLDELRQLHKSVRAKFNDAQILINILNSLDSELAMEIQERELHPELHPEDQQPAGVMNQVFGEGPIMAPPQESGVIQF